MIPNIDRIIKLALEEDIGPQDITTYNLVSSEKKGKGEFLCKSAGIIAGLQVCERVFALIEPNIDFIMYKKDGDIVKAGEIIATVSGGLRTLLTGERVALNFLQRMSGIATQTGHLADLIADKKAKLVDTRKTTPGMRILEKYAVRMGGGRNHRFGLFDGAMIKDNHIKAVGSITEAVRLLKHSLAHTIKIEVEAENIEQIREALTAGADIILLDNMTPAELKEAVSFIAGRALTEASGGINQDNIRAVADSGVDLISVGALTHSVKSLDISFNLVGI